jgi:hypothetical protein
MSDQQANGALPTWHQQANEEAYHFQVAIQQEYVKRVGHSARSCTAPSQRGTVEQTYIDAIMGAVVQAAVFSCGDSLEFEEAFVKRIHEKFAMVRSAIFRSRVIGQGPKVPPVPGLS